MTMSFLIMWVSSVFVITFLLVWGTWTWAKNSEHSELEALRRPHQGALDAAQPSLPASPQSDEVLRGVK